MTILDFYKAIAWGGLQQDTNGQLLNGWTSFSNNNPQLSNLYTLMYIWEVNGSNNSVPKCN